MKKLLYTLILCAITVIATAQDFSERWIGHFSYLQIKAVAQSSTKIYGAAENAVFSYDIASKEIQGISSVNGLSGEKISSLYYSENFKALLVGYENGIIDIVFDNGDDVFTVVDINEKRNIGDLEKRINHFIEEKGTLYISTNFGIIEFDLNRLEFGDTFFIGDNNSAVAVVQTTFFDGTIFAATRLSGIFSADQNDMNLIDSSIWNLVQTGRFLGIQTFGSNVYAATNGRQLIKYNGTSFVREIDYDNRIKGLEANIAYLTITFEDSIVTYDNTLKEVSRLNRDNTDISSAFSAALSFDDLIYFGSLTNGMFSSDFDSNDTKRINPNGPSLNMPSALDVFEGDIWTCYGQYRFFYAPIGDKRGISNYDKVTDTWKNIPIEETFGANPITDVAINHKNPSQVFFGAYNNGLLEVRDGQPFKLYDSNNTNSTAGADPSQGLETIPNTVNIVRVQSLFFREEELWLTTSLVPGTAIKKYNIDADTFESINFGAILNRTEMRFSDLLISESNTMFIGSYENGLIAHDMNTNSFREITNGLEDTRDIRAIALDKNDQLWVGADNGLRILSNASSVFQQQTPVLDDIVIREDGINQQILNGQFIWDIKVDGSNNKWIATQDSGVFYFSADGEEALEHFTTENSPLPSNFVQEIAIDGSTGAVYFATQGGLMQYQGLATESNKNLDKLRAFPNPVRPGYNKLVTIDGLTEGANVKITDIEGNLVFEKVSQGGSIQWDTRAFGKHKVASGVYLVLVTGEELEETKVAKLMIIR